MSHAKAAQALVAIAMLFAVSIGLWKFFGSRQGNQLVDQANAAVEAGNKFSAEAAAHYKTLITDDTIKSVVANRAKVRPTVDQAAPLFEKSAEQFVAAAAKFDQASTQMVDKQVSEYWTLKSEQMKKLAVAKQALRKIVLLLADETVTDIATFNKQADSLVDEAKKNADEAEAANAKADKIKEDNERKFSS